MSLNEFGEKINNLIENDDTENFYSTISEIIEDNRDSPNLDQNLIETFEIISYNINESNHEKKFSFICLFFEILISENIDFSPYLKKLFTLMSQSGLYSDEYVKRIINICSNASIKKKELFNNLIYFTKNSKMDYLYIIFSLAGFKDIIVDNISDSWELIIDLLDNPEIKSNSNSVKNVLKCLEILINLSEEKFRPYASSALYQALDYLTETDKELEKRGLMIIYSLTKYCDEQLQPLSENIIDFLKVLQNGNNIEINNLCNTMLKHFTGLKYDDILRGNENTDVNYDFNDNKINDNINDDNINDDDNNIMPSNSNNYAKEERIEKEEEPMPTYNSNELNKSKQKIQSRRDNEYEDEDEGEDNDNKNKFNYSYKKEDKINQNDEEINNDNKSVKSVKSSKSIKSTKSNKSIKSTKSNKSNKSKYKKRDIQPELSYTRKDNREMIDKDKDKDYVYTKKNTDNSNNNNMKNIDINAIIKKIKDLSDKQIIILDSIEQYKRDTKRIINQKKSKIQALEIKIEELKEKIRIEKNKKRNRGGKTNYQIRRKNYDDGDAQYNDIDY
jgi:hypothetical protein